MLAAGIDLQACQTAIAQLVDGQHAADSVLNNLGRIFSDLIFQGDFFQSTWIVAVAVINFFI